MIIKLNFRIPKFSFNLLRMISDNKTSFKGLSVLLNMLLHAIKRTERSDMITSFVKFCRLNFGGYVTDSLICRLIFYGHKGGSKLDEL